MRRLLIILFVSALAGTAGAAAVDPATALDAAKKHIAAKKYDDAVRQLVPAIEAAEKIADVNMQKQALTALHFYAAVAYSGLEEDDEALIHLEEALLLTPAMRNVDPARYDARFVALFERAKGDGNETRGRRFDDLYPGFAPYSSELPPVTAEIPAIEILGSRDEKRQFRDVTNASDREDFLAAFWAARDRAPDTSENEFRDEVLRRVAFADDTFAAGRERGALADRGRVFAVLGVPASVVRRTMTAREAANVQALSRGSSNIEVGTVEYWTYRREQLPIDTSRQTVTFRFVSHQGIGTAILQKDGIAINTLAAASIAPGKE
ncbi:MAG: GWxTD domain-containing protein [Thermoanaerobaculia bacterium]